MIKDTGAVMMEFNNAAIRIYYSITDQFSNSYYGERPGAEDLVRRQFGHYAYVLKCQLEELAQKVLKTYRADAFQDRLGFALAAKVNFYLHEFRSKANLR